MCAAENSTGDPTGRLGKRSVRVLLAEGDQELRRLLSWSLRNEGYDVTECTNGVDLLEYLRAFVDDPDPNGFRLIVSDLRMPGATGLAVLEQASQQDGFPPLILITPFGDESLDAQADRLGLIAFTEKSSEIGKLVQVAREIAPIAVSVSEGG